MITRSIQRLYDKTWMTIPGYSGLTSAEAKILIELLKRESKELKKGNQYRITCEMAPGLK